MKSNNSLAVELCRALTALGYSLVDSGRFDSALELAEDLERVGIFSAYEIAAAAHAGNGDLDRAISTLERGIAEDPDYWINWELLGSYRSETGDYHGAEEAYFKGLQCEGAWMDSIYYNHAVAVARSGDACRALEILEEVIDPELDEPAAMVRIGLLVELGRTQEALDFVDHCLEKNWNQPDAARILQKFGETKARLLDYAAGSDDLNEGT